jgi:hypothetical protein
MPEAPADRRAGSGAPGRTPSALPAEAGQAKYPPISTPLNGNQSEHGASHNWFICRTGICQRRLKFDYLGKYDPYALFVFSSWSV